MLYKAYIDEFNLEFLDYDDIVNNINEINRLEFSNSTASDLNLSVLTRVVRTDNNLTDVVFDGISINSKEATDITKFLKCFSSVASLTFSSCTIDKLALSKIMLYISKNNSIKSISFARTNIGDFGLELLIEAMNSNKLISEINLAATGVTEYGISFLSSKIERSLVLSSVNLAFNNINLETQYELVNAINLHKSVKYLTITSSEDLSQYMPELLYYNGNPTIHKFNCDAIISQMRYTDDNAVLWLSDNLPYYSALVHHIMVTENDINADEAHEMIMNLAKYLKSQLFTKAESLAQFIEQNAISLPEIEESFVEPSFKRRKLNESLEEGDVPETPHELSFAEKEIIIPETPSYNDELNQAIDLDEESINSSIENIGTIDIIENRPDFASPPFKLTTIRSADNTLRTSGETDKDQSDTDKEPLENDENKAPVKKSFRERAKRKSVGHKNCFICK